MSMSMADEQPAQEADPSPTRPVDLDLPTLGRLVTADGSDLSESAAWVLEQLRRLWQSGDGTEAVEADGGEEPLSSGDELIARLNGLGATAYRLARHVRTLVEFQAILAARPEGWGDGGR